jgi:hypothetical protein
VTAANRKRLVLVGPRGKRAGLKNQAQVALQLRSVELNSSGRGGGITSILFPTDAHALAKVQTLIARGYSAKPMAIQGSTRAGLRAAVTDSLLAELAVIFDLEKGSTPRAQSAVVREFTIWLCEKLCATALNDVQRIVARHHPDLGSRVQPDWWRKRIAERKK